MTSHAVGARQTIEAARPLSELAVDGAARAEVIFGPRGGRVAASRLLEAGAARFAGAAGADRVGLLMTNDRPTVEVILGALATATPVVSLPIPGRGVDGARYAASVTRMCRDLGIAEVVVADRYAGLLENAGQPVRRHSELDRRGLARPGAGFDLVQFTSGSTGEPRPVAVSDAQLGANVVAILETLAPRGREVVVSWLPLSHDMGLVGMFLAGLVTGCETWAEHVDIVLLDPATFLRRPSSWTEALCHWGGTFTAAPDFGYRLAVRRPPATRLDLSQLRCAIVGGEVVRADTLDSFAATFADHGLSRLALSPAYGMAEFGLAVTLTRPQQHWKAMPVSTRALADHRVAGPEHEDDTTALVASGEPLRGYDLACSTARGTGAISVRGPSLGADGLTGRPLADAAGWYRTGDVGFVRDGSLFVCGRGDDFIVANGSNVYAPAVEAAAGDVGGIRSGRVAAVGLPTGQWVIVAERRAGTAKGGVAAADVARRLRSAAVGVCGARPDGIALVPPGTIPMTTSGKLRRDRLRRDLVNGDVPVDYA